MNLKLEHHVHARTNCDCVVHRRDFLRVAAATGAAAGAMSWTDAICLSADDLRKRGMACILLWMGGGPSQFETFSPKPGHENGGETKAISTSVSGIQIADSLPKCAGVMNDLAIIRSMTSKEGSHPRASFLLHHGYLPMGGVKFPTLGSHVAQQIGDARIRSAELRAHRRPRRRLPAAAASWASITIRSCCRTRKPSPRTRSRPRATSATPAGSSCSSEVEADFGAVEGADIVADHQQADPQVVRDDPQPADGSVRPEQGIGQDARRLRPHAVRRRLPAWPGGSSKRASRSSKSTRTAGTRTTTTSIASPSDNATIDQPMAQLITDLKQRGMLDRTLVIWMGEFGRTPRINARAGRDHYPRAFNVALAGGGIRGGQVDRRNRRRRRRSDRPARHRERSLPHGLHDARHRRRPRKHEPHRPADQARRRRRSGSRAAGLIFWPIRRRSHAEAQRSRSRAMRLCDRALREIVCYRLDRSSCMPWEWPDLLGRSCAHRRGGTAWAARSGWSASGRAIGPGCART